MTFDTFASDIAMVVAYEAKSHSSNKLFLHPQHAEMAIVRYTLMQFSNFFQERLAFNMPAIDQCEPQVIRALEKAGWNVDKQPYPLQGLASTYYADLSFKSADDQRMIVVEVKCFPSNRSILDEFYRAVGQYMFYDALLSLAPPTLPIYLVVPAHVYEALFAWPAVQEVAQRAKIRIIVVSIETETVEQWINW